MSLKNRTTVITGATGGLGKVVARQFAERGANLVLVGSTLEKLNSQGKDLFLPSERWLSVPVDLVQPDAAQKVLDESLKKFGRVDILLHFVGGWIGGKPIFQVAKDDLSKMLQQHVWTTFYLAQVFGNFMVEKGWGRIIVISSPNAVILPANGSPYSVAKSAEEALILTLAEELKGSGVTSNILRVRTIDINHDRDRQPSEKTAFWTTPEEISASIEYLCSSEAGSVNGACIPLYGSP
jgi:NAD(P)-dependent dehydrogenase (short-subunit alcohol dehydrogenase family)